MQHDSESDDDDKQQAQAGSSCNDKNVHHDNIRERLFLEVDEHTP